MPKVRRKPAGRASSVRVNDQVLSHRQVLALRAAEAETQADDFGLRARAAARFQALEADLERRRQQIEIAEGIEETLGLARRRGEQVDLQRSPEAVTRVRVRSRDGLETLVRSGAISAAQFKAGMLYRDLYEATDAERGLKSQMTAPAFLGGGTARSAPGRAEAWAERLMRLTTAMAAIEAKVRRADRNQRAVQALREVAGHARCLSQLSAGGGGQALYRASLVLALEVVAEHFGVR